MVMQRLLFGLAWLALAAPAPAQDATGELADQARTMLAEPQRWVDAGLALAQPEVAPADRETVRAIAAGALPDPAVVPATPRPGRRFRLYVSQSMPTAELGAALAQARRHPDLTVVLRGLAPQQTLGQLRRRLLALSGRTEPGAGPPAIELDPPRFAAAGIGVVPTLVCEDGGRELARVAGLIDSDWLRREVDGGRRGDLGTLGEVLPIVEPDLMLALAQRAAGWDLEQLRRNAESRYWQRRAAPILPAATVARARRIDPSFVVTADLVAPDGRAIARAGETINPLARAPFTQRLLVFDATEARQCAAVSALIRAAGERRVTLMTTRWDAQRGFVGLAALGRELGRPVYLLGPELVERFRLERVPSMVEADGLEFVVSEFVAGDDR